MMSDSNLASVCPICGSAEAVHSCHATTTDAKIQTAVQEDPGADDAEDDTTKTFVVMYLGSSNMDRRFPPQSAMPWVMGEIKRSRDTFKEIGLEVGAGMLKATSYEGTDRIETVFEHKLHSLSRFAKTHQDPRCFAYLRRASLYSDFECHAFLAHEESVVPELFKCIRGATQRDLFDEIDNREPDDVKACYEVMYVGRAKVKGKKIFSNHVDDLVMRLEAKEIEKYNTSKQDGSNRRRHKSDTSVKSLPTLLDDKLVKENELQKISQAKIFKGAELHNDSPTGSNDDVHKSTFSDHGDKGQGHDGSSDHLSDSHSSAENITDTIPHSNSGDHLKDMFTGLQSSHPDGHIPEGEGEIDNNSHQNSHNNTVIKSTNRTMLFRIGGSEIALISPDRKLPIIEKKFKNISSVSQGNIRADSFGFISREPGSLLICHLLKCCSPELVDEIMQALRTSFQTAYEQSRLQTQQICINCPLQQYHKLCQDINGMSPENAYSLLCKRIQQLPEKEATELYHALQDENPQCHEESVEAMMIAIRKICEQKQREHSHISDSNKGGHKADFYLTDMKMKPQKSAFDSIRNRAKKTLTTSFESILSNVHNKTEEVKEAFRHRSGTTDSEGGSFSKSMDHSTGSTPEASPAPSPMVSAKEHVHFDFPVPLPLPPRDHAALL